MSRFIVILCAALSASACLKIYSPEIQQGNIVDQEMIDKLKSGMTRAQVRFVLGTPLVADPFHADRWDYVYFHKKSFNAPPERRQLTVVFEGDALARIEGDVVNTVPPASAAGPDEHTQPAPIQPAPGPRAL